MILMDQKNIKWVVLVNSDTNRYFWFYYSIVLTVFKFKIHIFFKKSTLLFKIQALKKTILKFFFK